MYKLHFSFFKKYLRNKEKKKERLKEFLSVDSLFNVYNSWDWAGLGRAKARTIIQVSYQS